ncbi:MAG: (d)CMP kinase [Oscillospiraceae bacterium]|nr:(d)CMP kinase [Oscillospiraceae bacterium]
MGINIALDGPSGAGKSTIAKEVAKTLGYVYVDTGALYRSIGLYSVRHGAKTGVASEVVPLLPEIQLELKYIDGTQRVIMNGEDVSEAIRTPEIAMAASSVSAIPEVREFLLSLQRNMAEKHNIVMDGRDIGTVILPNAQVKIFMTASAEERANRRLKEHLSKGQEISYEEILKEINERDYNDSHRAAAPLKKADDAYELDTSNLDIDGAVSAVLEIVDERLNALRPARGMVPAVNRFFYSIIRGIALVLLKIVMKVRYEGLENIPKTGSYVIAPNHHTLLDPVAIGVKINNISAYMAKEDIFDYKIANALKVFHAFPVKRGKSDKSAIRTAIKWLDRGYNLTIFPEGTRSKDGKLGTFKSGVAFVASEANADVLPVGITKRKTRFGRIFLTVRFGKLIPYYKLKVNSLSSSELRHSRDIILNEVKGLIDE